MGTIKAALQAEDEQFISLHLLLEMLQIAENCTLADGAQYLCRQIYSANPTDDLSFFSLSPAKGMRWVNNKTPLELLLYVANSGFYAENKGNSYDGYENSEDIPYHLGYFFFGFKRTEIARFLETRGVFVDFSIKTIYFAQSPAYKAMNTPSTDTELLGKYRDAEREKARLQQENDRLTAEIEQLKNKPVGTRQLNTLLTIIAAACEYGKLELKTPAKTAGVIRQTMSGMGVDVGETTIEGYLKEIPTALALKSKATK